MAVKHSGRLALAGILTGLALCFLLLTVTPITTVALAALAGVCGIPIVMELGKKTALLHYAAVALIALLLIPAVEGKTMYIAFFGYYTVFKAWVESTSRSRTVEWCLKLAVFLASLCLAGGVLYAVLTPAFPEWFSPWMLPVGAAALCVVFVIYDRCLTGLVGMYAVRIRPRLRRMFRF